MKMNFTHKTIAAALLLGGMLVATPALAQHRQPRGGGSQGQGRSSAPRERVERPSVSSSSSPSTRRDVSPSVSSPRERSTVQRSEIRGGSSSRPSSSSSSVSRPSTRGERSVTRPQLNDRPSMGTPPSTSRSESRTINGGTRPSGGGDLGTRPGRGGSGNFEGGNVNRPSRGSGKHDGGIINRPPRNGNDRGGNDRDGYGRRPGNSGNGSGNDNGGYGKRPGSGSGNFDNHGNNFRNDNRGGKDRPGGFNARPDNRPRNERPGGGDPNRFGRYNQYRYHDGFRPHGPHHDRFYDHYRYGWNRPIMPPARPYRHSIWYYRPTIPYGFRPYRNAPIVDGILGLFFGTLYDASLDYLYYNGFNIDGYYDNIVYLRDVPLFDYDWPDVMLRYDDYNQLNYAQFAIVHSYNDRARYNRLYRRLCASYGNPVSYLRGSYPQVTWVGGDGRGYITLSLNHEAGRYYTALSFGY